MDVGSLSSGIGSATGVEKALKQYNVEQEKKTDKAEQVRDTVSFSTEARALNQQQVAQSSNSGTAEERQNEESNAQQKGVSIDAIAG